VRVVVAAMLLMMASWLVSGLLRQFMLPMNNTGADLAGQITTFPRAKLARVSPEPARGLGHSPRGSRPSLPQSRS
jgi:hypothetical protein